MKFNVVATDAQGRVLSEKLGEAPVNGKGTKVESIEFGVDVNGESITFRVEFLPPLGLVEELAQ